MLEWFKDKFIFNHQLALQVRSLENLISELRGQNEELGKWNEELKIELKETKTLLYKKAGIIEDLLGPLSTKKPVQRIETWRTAQSKLEERWKVKEQLAVAKGELDG